MSPLTKLPDCVTGRGTSTHSLILFLLVFLFPQIEQESFALPSVDVSERNSRLSLFAFAADLVWQHQFRRKAHCDRRRRVLTVDVNTLTVFDKLLTGGSAGQYCYLAQKEVLQIINDMPAWCQYIFWWDSLLLKWSTSANGKHSLDRLDVFGERSRVIPFQMNISLDSMIRCALCFALAFGLVSCPAGLWQVEFPFRNLKWILKW